MGTWSHEFSMGSKTWVVNHQIGRGAWLIGLTLADHTCVIY
ncbi:hypothetical protein HMPREF0043_02325 [Actinobaculum sp. oral taxon 183 str. F0552]|nr:hypothetical protein HMPREF0043_02325 [Actinobaculum sp. oral taxon 183 str. F0552]